MTTTTDSTAGAASTAGVAVENAPDPAVRFGLFVVLLACIIASGDVLVYLAQQAKWDGWRAYLLPVLIDLPGFLGGRIWLRRAPTNTKTRDYARSLTLAALSASIVGNIVGHLVKSHHLGAGVALVIASSVVAPVVLWAVLHLDALLTPTAHRQQPTPAAAAAETVPVATGTSTAPATGSMSAPTRRPATKRTDRPARRGHPTTATPGGAPGRDKARAHWDTETGQGRTPSGAELARVAGVDASLGRRWRRDWENETTDTDTTDGMATDVAGLATEDRDEMDGRAA